MLSTLVATIDWNPLIKATSAGVLIFALMCAAIVMVALAKDVDYRTENGVCVPDETVGDASNHPPEMADSMDATAV